MRIRWSTWGFLLSAALHVGVAAGVAVMPKDAVVKRTTVAVVGKKKEQKKDDKPKDEPPPPPPKPIEPPRRAAPKPKAPENTPPPPPPPAAKPAAAPAPALAALPNLGISMAGGPGVGGIAVPQGDPAAAAAAPQAGDAPRAAPRPKDECTEDAVKPKLIGAISQGAIASAAQAAGGVEGKIRLELLIDETGNVTSVRVMAGLGGAIDEAAIAAAKRVKATPASKCGRPAAGRLVVAITVRNPD
ncbi:MAG: TonB family protein [Minicystis sp.]